MNVATFLDGGDGLRQMRRAKAKSPRCQLRWHRPPFSKGVSNGCASRHVRFVPLNPLDSFNSLDLLDLLNPLRLLNPLNPLNSLNSLNLLNPLELLELLNPLRLLNPHNPLHPLSMPLPFPPLKKGGRGDLLFRPLHHG